MENTAQCAKKALQNAYLNPNIKEPTSQTWRRRRELAKATRTLIEALMTNTSDEKDLEQATAYVHTAIDILNQSKQIYGRYQREAHENGSNPIRCGWGYELSPIDGQSNPLASEFNIWLENDRVFGEVTMGWAYEGPPHGVHGGIVAALFDQLLGVGQALTGDSGFTGSLTTNYLKPTPLNTQLTLEGWVERVEGRKRYLAAEMRANGITTATCSGIFIIAKQ